jgi:hypothetical protein
MKKSRAVTISFVSQLAGAALAGAARQPRSPRSRLRWERSAKAPRVQRRHAARVLEAAVVQWYWLHDLHPKDDRFNSIHERLGARRRQHHLRGRHAYRDRGDYGAEGSVFQALAQGVRGQPWRHRLIR